jgi:Proprotein convertase P-domain/Subtilase family
MTITVGAVGADERHAYYSTAGASLFISAPGGDVDDDTRHFTAAVGGGCHSSSVGTSFAAPLVSGVVAMMLEVNPNLGWRDVQGILAKSARPVTEDPSDDSATVNGAGMWVSNYYGFGILDAAAAVELSRTWAIYAEERLIAKDSGILDLAVYDDASAETVSSIIITETIETPINQRQAYAEFVVEAVEVLLDISHFSRGDLRIRLVSPSGTESILHPGYLPENSQPGSDQPWKLMTIRNWGESPYGEWKLAIVDEKAGDLDVCVDEPGYHLYYSDNTEVTCPYIEKAAICTNGGYNPNFFDSGNYESLKTLTDSDGRTIEDACCVCGGGVGRDAFRDSLHHWTIAIYGREEYVQTKLATFSPTTRPSQSPTSFPSDLPTDAPTVPPTHPPNTIFPTLSPILSPTLIPSAALMTQSPTMSLTPSEDGYPSQDPSLAASYDPSDLPTTTTSSNTAIPQGSSNPTIPQGSSNPTMNPLSFSTNSTDPYSMSPSSAPFTFDGSSMPSLAPSNSADVGGTDSTSSNTGINDTVGNRTASNGGDGEPTPAPSSSTSPTPKMGHAQQGSYSMRGSSSSRSSSSSTVSIKSDMTLWILLIWMAKTVLETL